MDERPWWSPERVAGLAEPEREAELARLALAVEHHVVLRTSTDEVARRRAARWLRAHGLSALVDPPPRPGPATRRPGR